MKREAAINVRGCDLREFQGGVAPKPKSALLTNPPRPGVDFNHALSPNTVNHNTITDSYLVAIHYPFSSDRIPES